MGLFSSFFSDEPGAADAPIIDDNSNGTPAEPALCDFALILMETGKI
jgi:hypothetical protein